MKNAAPLLALIVVVAAASFYFLNGTGVGPGDSDLERTGVESVIPREGAKDAVDDLADVASKGTREAREAATSTDVAPSVDLIERDASGAVVVAEEAKATVVGRITDGAGRPLGGAEVLVSEGHGDTLSQLTLDSRNDHEDTLVRTGEDGRFEATVPAGKVGVAVGLDGFAPLEREVKVGGGDRLDLGDMRLAEGVRLSGRVLDAGGDGVAGASVLRKRKNNGGMQIFGGRAAPAVAVTDSLGRFQIVRQAPGPFEFVVAHDEHPPEPFSGQTERAGEAQDGIVVTLKEGASLAGRVIDLPPSGTKGLRVTARPDTGDGLGFLFDDRPGGPVTAPVDENGRFTLKGLEAGTVVRVGLFEGRQRWDGRSRRARAVSAQVGDRDVQLAYSVGATLRFRCVDESGDPIEAIGVDAGFDFARPRVRRDQTTINGEVTIAGLWPEEGGEAIRLQIDATGFEPYRGKGIVVLPEEDRDLGPIVLKARPQVILTVRSRETGLPVVGAAVTMRPYRDPAATDRSIRRTLSFDVEDDGDESSERHGSFEVEGEVRATTDEEGRCALDATPGKTVEFLLQHPDHAETVDGPLAVSTSESLTEHDIALEVGGSVRVTVTDGEGLPIEGAKIERRGAEHQFSERGETQSHDTDASGVVLLTGLPAGTLSFRLVPADLGGSGGIMVMDTLGGPPQDDDGGEWTSVVVRPGETTELALLAPMRGAVVGIVREVGVPLAGASITLRRPKKGALAGIMSIGPQGPKAISDARGEFRFDGIEEGKYELVISHTTRAMEEVWPVEAEGRETEAEIDLDVTIVEGVVIDENGDPVAGALVRPEKAAGDAGEGTQMFAMVMITDDGGGAGGTLITTGGTTANETYTDEDGQFTLRGVTAGIRIEITATAKGYDEARSEAFEVDAGATRDDVKIQFSKPGTIRVAIENSPGGGMVMLRRRGEFRGQPRIEQFSGAQATIEGVEPGEWTVSLLGGPGGDINTDPDEVEVTVVAGETATAEFKVN